MRAALLVLTAGCSFSAGTGVTGDGAITDVAAGSDTLAGSDGSGSANPAREKPITISKHQVTGDPAGFPTWIDLTDAQVQAGARSDGADLYFTDATGAALSYELVGWDATAGHLTAWVKTSLSHSTDTVIYLRYGTTAGVTAPAPADVFASYAAVWHFDDTLATPTVADACGAHAGKASGLNASRHVAGQLGGAFNFDGATMQVTFANMLQHGTPHTMSAWVSQRTASNFDSLIVVGSPAPNQSRWFYTAYTTANVAVGLYMNDVPNTGAAVQNSGWHLLHWVFDGKTKSTVYLDGAPVGSFTHTNGMADTGGAGGWIGYAPSAPNGGWGADNWLNGIVDEVRIATVQETAGWIATEYANQSSPSTFYTVGPEQPVP